MDCRLWRPRRTSRAAHATRYRPVWALDAPV